jgi:ubiquinone/menaquinone biosynthesis C-methylase UbiE
VVGIDVAEHMIEQATEHAGATEAGGSARFALCDAADAAGLPQAPFGAAMCVGNGLAFVESKADLRRVLGGVAAALRPGAPATVVLSDL